MSWAELWDDVSAGAQDVLRGGLPALLDVPVDASGTGRLPQQHPAAEAVRRERIERQAPTTGAAGDRPAERGVPPWVWPAAAAVVGLALLTRS